MNARQIVGKNMRDIRTSAGLSQGDVAKLMDVEQTYVSGLERGVRNPTLSTLERAAAALNVTIIDLLRPPTS
jgi:transcriptional regulator with XRE-family HTH domain